MRVNDNLIIIKENFTGGCMNTTRKLVTKKMIYRSVASSTALETGESIKEIEKKLKKQQAKYSKYTLAF